MSKYIISLLLLCLLTDMQAQQDTLSTTQDSLPAVKQPVKIRFGFDLGKYVWARLNNSTSYDFYADANFYKNYYLIVETGTETHQTETSLLKYQTKGNYYKIGIDYNMYENWLDMDNDITVGVRYAFADFDYLLQAYRINQPDAAFTPQMNEVNQKFDHLSAQWLDITGKIQAETFRHLYIGYAVSLKYLLNYSSIDNFEVSYIPGFFERNAYSRFGFGMQYFISYQIKF